MTDLATWIERHAAFAPGRIALLDDEAELSYRDLAGRIARLSGWLAEERSLAVGDRVAWLGHNAWEQIAVLFACARAGLTLLPLNWRLTDAELQAILDDAGPALLVVHRSCGERLASFTNGTERPVVTAGFDVRGLPRVPEDGADRPLRPGRADHASPALLVYTSGTTGTAKGAVLSQRALLFNSLNSVHMHGMTASDRVLTALPMFHVGGLNIQTLPALYCGATVRLQERFEPERTLSAIEAFRPTLTVQVPATLSALMARPRWAETRLDSLRGVTTGSTDVPVPLIERLHARGVPVVQVYGATETGPIAVYQRFEDAFDTVGSIGRPGLHTEVELTDDHGNAVGDGAPGEIRVRGPHVADGYWDRELGRARPFPDGWFASGDVAERDGEGLYWFRDRIKHVIISGGENVYPAELERVLNASGLLREAAVVGRDDERWGQVPVVAAVRGEAAVDAAEILALFDGTLARFKHPKDVVFLDALPRNALGKVEVTVLREQVGR